MFGRNEEGHQVEKVLPSIETPTRFKQTVLLSEVGETSASRGQEVSIDCQFTAA